MNEQHYNHLLPSWNHRAQANVQIEPLFLFPRTSSNVHACAMWFYSSSYWRSASKVEEKSWSKKFSLFWSFFVSRFPSLYFPLQFVFVSCNEKILISITQQKKATPKNNWNNLLLAAGGKFDCSRRTTEGNWQLLNQSCDDDFVMKWKKNSNRDFSHHAREATPEKIIKNCFYEFFSALTSIFLLSIERGARARERKIKKNALRSHTAREGVWLVYGIRSNAKRIAFFLAALSRCLFAHLARSFFFVRYEFYADWDHKHYVVWFPFFTALLEQNESFRWWSMQRKYYGESKQIRRYLRTSFSGSFFCGWVMIWLADWTQD